jgi:hypothetical protein
MGIEVLLEEEDRCSSSATETKSPETKAAMDPSFVSSTGRLLQLPLRVADDSHEQENTKIEVVLDEEALRNRNNRAGYKDITRHIGRLFKGCLLERVNGEEKDDLRGLRLGVVEMDPFFAKRDALALSSSLAHSHHQENTKIEVLLHEEELQNNIRGKANSTETELEEEEVLSEVNAAATPSPITITMYLNGANDDF